MAGISAQSFNGRLVIPSSGGDKQSQQTYGFPFADRGALLGDGLFETLPIWNNQTVWLDKHLERLMTAASSLGFSPDPSDLEAAIAPVLPFAKESGGNAILRLTLSRGSGGRGLLPPDPCQPNRLATLSPFPLAMAFADMAVATSSIRRNEGSPTSRIKSLGYLDNILATKEAAQACAEDALLLNNRGHICCTTICNIFAIFGNHIITPKLDDGVLNGIMRQKLLELLPQAGFTVEEASLTPKDIKKADGLFATNSLRVIRRIVKLDDQPYSAQAGDAIERCQNVMKHHLAEEFGILFS